MKPGWRCFDFARLDLYAVDRALAGQVDEYIGCDHLKPDYPTPWPVENEGLWTKIVAEPTPIDHGDFDGFCGRWMDALAAAQRREA